MQEAFENCEMDEGGKEKLINKGPVVHEKKTNTIKRVIVVVPYK